MAATIIVSDSAGKRREIVVSRDSSLSQALFAAGLRPPLPLCSGLGRCGLCRVRYLTSSTELPQPTDTELEILSSAELESGMRLACRHFPRSGDQIELPPVAASVPVEVHEVLASPVGPLRLAVDLGTTSVYWEAFSEGIVVARGRALNPQLGAGSEIMSRLALAARGEAGLLRQVVLDLLVRIARELPGPLESMCVAGNSAMTYLLLELSPDGLAAAPYKLDFRGGVWHSLTPDLPPCYIPPLLGPFAGGDLSAGLAALDALDAGGSTPYLLADMGTNGEFALVLDRERVLVASVPLGPALEGIGLRHGSLAGPGVATRFELGPQGLTCSVLGDGSRPVAVSGTGYLSLVSVLLRVGLLDAQGGFRTESTTPLAMRLARELGASPRGEARLRMAPGLWLHAGDVEELLKVKAAFNMALSALLAEAGLPASELTAVFLAGALGEHASPGDLERLGFLSPVLAKRVRVAGNTSLAGARRLLENMAARKQLEQVADRATVLDLTARPTFEKDYLTRMVFEYVP
ncbi:putative metal-binding protein [Desulfocurvibacter africanus PCS]|uniref:Putative metal-binding protein n=1 Tax=Desulfocurvibacter africanus PCS TaxID=1262666 RepID=M5PRT4_DESAF|nr:ASKHA domain-containing protein [Desulfocurvibacter africanus]EMG36785.1 putative metal-binding protein [Desulfocurvibacter africanus PCS]